MRKLNSTPESIIRFINTRHITCISIDRAVGIGRVNPCVRGQIAVAPRENIVAIKNSPIVVAGRLSMMSAYFILPAMPIRAQATTSSVIFNADTLSPYTNIPSMLTTSGMTAEPNGIRKLSATPL